MWDKLKKVDFDKPIILHKVISVWSEDWLDNGDISEYQANDGEFYYFTYEDDTFQDLSVEDFRDLLNAFYGRDEVMGLILIFRQDEYYFSTFRGYDWRKHNWYDKNIGKEYWINYAVGESHSR